MNLLKTVAYKLYQEILDILLHDRSHSYVVLQMRRIRESSRYQHGVQGCRIEEPLANRNYLDA